MESPSTASTVLAEPDAAAVPPPPPPHLVRREAILDANRGLAGYRLRILWAGGESSDQDAGAATLQLARAHGASTCFAYVPHWIDASTTLLSSPVIGTLPRRRVYLEIPEGLEATEETLHSLQSLALSGPPCSIRGDLAALPDYAPFLPFCRAVSFDPASSSKADIFRQSFQHKQASRLLMAVNPPNKASLDNFLLLGFTLFLGHWPHDQAGTAGLAPRQKTLLRLITLIMGGGEIPEIQSCLQQDSALVKTLLDMVNTPAYGLQQPVESLHQAIMLLGRRQLQRWIQVLMYTETGRPVGFLSPALIQATARAHLMESLSTLSHPDQPVRAEAAFTTGILSVVDQLFHGGLRELLGQVQVDVAIRQALLERQGELGPGLRLATLVFPSGLDPIEEPAALLATLGLDAAALDPLVQQAFAWAHGITRAAP